MDKRGFHTGKWKTTYTQESRQEENTIYRKVDKKYIQVSTQEADIYRYVDKRGGGGGVGGLHIGQ